MGVYQQIELAPLDYRYSLDAAMTAVAGRATAVRCDVPELMSEIRRRIPSPAAFGDAEAALWVEPLLGTWRSDLITIAEALPHEAPLVIVASRPLARRLPERRSWNGQPLGMQPSGIRRLRQALADVGFRLEAIYGVHSLRAIVLNLLSEQAGRWGYPGLSDRLHFAGRLCYCTIGPFAALSTVALLMNRKEHGAC